MTQTNQRLTPSQLSRELREEVTPDLKRRRWIVGLSLLGVAAAQVVTAYQTGLVKDLPDPPGPFDSARVDASDYAYSRLQMPDGPLMLVTYGITAALATAGGKDRAEQSPWLPLATAGKAAFDTLTAVELAREEWRDNKALCAYCQAATVASAVSLALAVPEALRAWRHLRGRDENAAAE